VNLAFESSRAQRNPHINAGKAGTYEKDTAILINVIEGSRGPGIGDVARARSGKSGVSGREIAESEYNFIGYDFFSAAKGNLCSTFNLSDGNCIIPFAFERGCGRLAGFLQNRLGVPAINLARNIVARFHATVVVKPRPAQKMLRIVGYRTHVLRPHVQQMTGALRAVRYSQAGDAGALNQNN
jgi:hypothetical protein